MGIVSARDILDFSGTWQTKVNFGGQTYEGPITIIQTWSADKGYVTGTSIDGPSFTGEIDPYFGDVIKAQWIWTKVRPAGGDILFSVNAIDENRTLMSISGTAYYTNGAVAGDWYCYDRSTKITVPTVAPLPRLRVQSRTDYLGQNVTGDEGVEILLSVWEPGPLHEVPVPGAIIQLDVFEEGTNNRPSGWSGTKMITTEGNGFVTWRWLWTPKDLGKHWIMKMTASKSGYESGSFTTSFDSMAASGPPRIAEEIDDINSRDSCTFTVRVTNELTGAPVPDAVVDLRYFKIWDEGTQTFYNSKYWDYGPYKTDSDGVLTWTWKWSDDDYGDIWRIDAYASKSGYENSEWRTVTVVGKDIAASSPNAANAMNSFSPNPERNISEKPVDTGSGTSMPSFPGRPLRRDCPDNCCGCRIIRCRTVSLWGKTRWKYPTTPGTITF